MKKLINSPETVVTDALAGMAAAHPVTLGGHREQGHHPGRRPDRREGGLVSGGGSGHEPLHGGFVGYGMLDAACPGEVFTSPVPDQMLAATKAVNGGAGVLHIVKNYTGDVLNFQMAAELAADEGIEVASVVVNDDVAVQDSLYTAGRRGVGATVFVEKIAGAPPSAGSDLAEVAAVAAEVNERSRSFGVALTSCTVPPRASRLRPGRVGDRARHRHPRRAGPHPGPLQPARDIAAYAHGRHQRRPAAPATCSSWSTAWAAPR
jgi:dihydroxyacetone kinase-like protein